MCLWGCYNNVILQILGGCCGNGGRVVALSLATMDWSEVFLKWMG